MPVLSTKPSKFEPLPNEEVLYGEELATFLWKNDGNKTCRIRLKNRELTVSLKKITERPTIKRRQHDSRAITVPLRANGIYF